MNRRLSALLAASLLVGSVPLLAAGRPPALPLYKGKYPFDRVAGVTFVGHPVVRAAVRRAAPSRAMATTILSAGVASPIEMSPRWILSGSCQPHNCAWHNWSILIDRRTATAIVCHKPDDAPASWYRAGRRIGGAETCAHGIADLPRAVTGARA